MKKFFRIAIVLLAMLLMAISLSSCENTDFVAAPIAVTINVNNTSGTIVSNLGLVEKADTFLSGWVAFIIGTPGCAGGSTSSGSFSLAPATSAKGLALYSGSVAGNKDYGWNIDRTWMNGDVIDIVVTGVQSTSTISINGSAPKAADWSRNL